MDAADTPTTRRLYWAVMAKCGGFRFEVWIPAWCREEAARWAAMKQWLAR